MPARPRADRLRAGWPGSVARIEFAPEVADDLDRILEHLQRHHAEEVATRLHGLVDAVAVLATNPLIGRPGRNDKRELVIGRGARGHVALYRYVPAIDIVFVLAVRSQREAGFVRP